MGRLQKKKSPAEKKRKRRVSDDGVDSGGNGGTAVKSAAPAAKKAFSGAKVPAKRQKDNFFHKAIQFLREVKVELKKVTWPSRKQTMGSTVVVIILVMIISFFLGAVDIGLSSLVRVILQ
ncbi:MAG: preprotein translocase subunit SecE [Desulfobacterales bacterium]|nr:preprotein translocase subunit SecE [Desulfobacterales bacterium]